MELGEERTAAFEEEMELEVKGEEEKRCIKKRGKRGEYKKRKFIDLSYYGRKTRIRQRLQDVDWNVCAVPYKDSRYITEEVRYCSNVDKKFDKE